MSIVQEVGEKHIPEYLREAIRRQVPVALTYRFGWTWYGGRSRVLREGEGRLWLEYPVIGGDAPEIHSGLLVGASFKIKHHKHVFSGTVEAVGQFQFDGQPPLRALCLSVPRAMQRIQRRAYNRVEVPRNRSVLATFWQGGPGTQPDEPSEGSLTWEGWVTNISAGGFQVRTANQSMPALDEGDAVGVRINFGQEYEAVEAQAQVRHQAADERGVTLVGFQFVGLNETAEGRRTLRKVSAIVCQFQRLSTRRARTVA